MILAVEPQCIGFEHARYNAALLATAISAFPADDVSFLCERSHGRHVTDALARGGHQHDKVALEYFEPAWPANAWSRLRAEETLCSEVLDSARARQATAVIFCSLTSYTLIALKRLLARGRYNGPVIAVPHSVLIGTQRRTRRLWNRPIDIVAALGIPAPPNLRLIALSRTILNSVQPVFPENNWRHLDHPYLFYSDRQTDKKCNALVKIGIFGMLRNNIEDYVQVLRSVRSVTATVDFELVGYLNAQTTSSTELARLIPGLSFKPLSAEVYDEVASSLDYMLNISHPLHHRYVASTTLLDAFNYIIPVLSLHNALFEEYQDEMGDIGESFTSIEALVERIGTISSEFPLRRYRSQTETMRRERIRFSPEQLSKRLRVLVEL